MWLLGHIQQTWHSMVKLEGNIRVIGEVKRKKGGDGCPDCRLQLVICGITTMGVNVELLSRQGGCVWLFALTRHAQKHFIYRPLSLETFSGKYGDIITLE